MYEDYYGFAEKPFRLMSDPKYLYLSESHTQALERLQKAREHGESFVLFTGGVGTGKTMLCRALLAQADHRTFASFLPNPLPSEEDLLTAVLQDLGLLPRTDERGIGPHVPLHALRATLRSFLLSLAPLGACVVIVIDEAQDLHPDILDQLRTLLLDQLRILSVVESRMTMQVVLVGAPELVPLLQSPLLRQLDACISTRIELEPLSAEEVGRYIAHRLSIANPAYTVAFTPKAVERIHAYTGGVPRLVNVLCDRALLGGYLAQSMRIDAELLTAAAEGLDLESVEPKRQRWLHRLRRGWR